VTSAVIRDEGIKVSAFKECPLFELGEIGWYRGFTKFPSLVGGILI